MGLLRLLWGQTNGSELLHACTTVWFFLCRLEDLPTAVESADSMLEHLVKFEASISPADCFQIMGMQPVLQQHAEGSLSVEQCTNLIREALQ